MELSHLRALLDGMELSNYRTMQDDHDAMKKKLASVTLELQACREKLAVYMRWGGRLLGARHLQGAEKALLDAGIGC